MPLDTVVFFTTQTSATASIWRILRTINDGVRKIRSLGHEAFLSGSKTDFKWSDLPAEDYLIEANCHHDLGAMRDIAVRRFIVNFRDPRDRICNEFMWNLIHPKTKDEPQEQIEARAAEMLAEGMDKWVMSRFAGPLTESDYYNLFMRNVRKIPDGSRSILTYARLCIDFDSFVEKGCGALGVALTPALKEALEVERTEKLDQNNAWIGNRWKGSDVMPGRYKRELSAETIAFLSEKYAPVLRMMARLDADYAPLYLENVSSRLP